MALKQLQIRHNNVQFKRGTAAEWEADDPKLRDGEIGIETDTLRMKVGDGRSAFSSLGAMGGGGTSIVATSRAITAADNGSTLECTATVTLTVPEGLPPGFGCAVIPSGTTSVARSGAALLNGAGTTLTRAAASNAIFAITARASAADSYVVTGS